jgi:2-polyprenyl-3-methyl-5-hydroxy-6-metoxy-1,4-benzoquinol methylase
MSDPLRGFDPKGTYDAASLDYEQASRAFWEQLSSRTVDLAAPMPGESVLDVPCGTGPSVVMAAAKVGSDGLVLGVDYAEQMLAIAQEKVTDAGLSNVELRIGDMTDLDLQPGMFDVVLCVLGLFFVDDMPGLVRSLWELLRPGGRLAITVLGDLFFAPMLDVFVDAVHAERPGFDVVEPWRRTEDPHTIQAIMAEAGVPASEIQSEVDIIPIQSSDWWSIVQGTGLRRTAMALNPDQAERVSRRCEQFIQENDVRQVELASHHIIAVKT